MKLNLAILCGILLSGCGLGRKAAFLVTDQPEFKCIKGVVFVVTDDGISWLPELDGKPRSCINFSGEYQEITVPEDVKK